MGKSHDRAARRMARILGDEYNPKTSPDVRGPRGRAEVKSYAHEIPKAIRQIGGGPGPAWVVLPKSEHDQALEYLDGLKTGLRDYNGNVVKRSTRKRR